MSKKKSKDILFSNDKSKDEILSLIKNIGKAKELIYEIDSHNLHLRSNSSTFKHKNHVKNFKIILL
mgnify:CR=1 FL=1